MRRVVLTLVAAVALTFATGLPVASFGLTNVTLSCDDGTSIVTQVDVDTLASLTDAVQAMTLYPAGLSCTLTQSLAVHALGGVASAWPGGGFIVGGGRFQLPCDATGILTYWVNFGLSAHTETDFAGPTRGGTLNLTVPGGQCIPEGHVTSKPTCLTINAEQPKPPDGAWFAYLWSHATQKSGSLSTFPDDFGSGWKDTGNPAKQTIGPDRVVLADASTCPTNGSPDPDGLGSRPILNGNITIHAIE
ncbi:MAG: hypothetical protein E6I51_02470 [Chloroflexi bacterium]|nr:MAG: hypothetical protein E6I51_02470 [Chloroflexota bacterium]